MHVHMYAGMFASMQYMYELNILTDSPTYIQINVCMYVYIHAHTCTHTLAR